MSRPVTAARAAAWLRFAAAREAREVHLVLPAKQPPPQPEDDVEEELDVPPLETAVWLNLNLVYDFRLRLPPLAGAGAGAVAFEQLRVLSITRCRASGADLSRVFPRAYPLFIENTSKLPKSKALTVGIKIRGNALRSSLLHLLRKCGGITKLEIELIPTDKVSLCDLYCCDCVQSEALRTNNVTLDSLEHVEFHFFTDDDVDLAKMMFMCKNTIKKMVINVPDDVPLNKEVREKIQSFSHPRTTLKIGGPSSHKRNACQCSEHDWY
ncbi:hypothetical protein EJB05_11909, partial [Eragrostis curvula]